MAGFSTRRFFTDSEYRENEALQALGRSLRNAWSGMAREARETLEALGHILDAADGRSLTSEEKQQVKRQIQDLVKVIPMLAVFALPGGMVFLPLLLKVLPFDLRLSAFREISERESEETR